MKSRTISFVILGLVLMALAWRSAAQPTPNPPGQISYQGFLTDANGIPLATNSPVNYNVIFRIFDASTGGNVKWAEQQVVTVDRGYFTVMLGNGIPISGPAGNLTTVFSGIDASDRYLEITVLGLAPNDPPIAPRLRLLASPYSLLANSALNVDGGALTTGTVVDARLSSNVALRAGGNFFTNDQHIVAGDLYMDSTHAVYARNAASGVYEVFAWPRYTDNVTYLNYGANGFNIRNNANTSAIFMANNGNIGIGTTTPGYPLNFGNSPGDKISLWGSSGDHYGFGIQNNLMQIFTAGSYADIAFGYGQSGSMTETMRVTGTGQVGIGTSAPGQTLQIGDPNINGSQGMIRLASRSSAGGASRTWDIGVPQTGDTSSGVGYSFVVNDGGTTDFMVQWGSGNVGIGTTTPGAKLDVNGNVNVAGKVTSPEWNVQDVITVYSGTDNLSAGQYNTSGNFVCHGGTLRITVSGSGRSNGGGNLIGVATLLDGAFLPQYTFSSVLVFVNDTGHHAFVSRTFTLHGIAAGSHTLKLQAESTTYIDSNDQLYATVEELPF